jgi:LPS-assembly protein
MWQEYQHVQDTLKGGSPTSSICVPAVHRFLSLLFLGVFLCVSVHSSLAQPMPDRKNVFTADRPQEIERKKSVIQQATSPDGLPAKDLDFQAPSIEFDRAKNIMRGSGGVIVSQGGVQLQGDEGSFDLNKDEGAVSGDVVMTTSEGVLTAKSARLHVPSETGEFEGLEFSVEQGGYDIRSDHGLKLSEFEFELRDTSLSTCHCADGGLPWEIRSSRCHITQDGYAHAYDSSVYFQGAPVFYSPYLLLPVKTDRASGLLAPQWGAGNRNGFSYRQPVFVVLDDSSDLTLTPFIQTMSRYGTGLDYQQAFSYTSNLKLGGLYSNESWRDGNLRGLNTLGYADPAIDTNRTGQYLMYQWQSGPQSDVPLQVILDGHHASDNLLVREIDSPNIGDMQSQFLVSTAVARGTFLSQVNVETMTEYTQMLYAPQETQFQRLPQASISTTETFRPFGFNPYGLKLVTSGGAVTTNFWREDGYGGWRTDVVPRVAMPFHVSNYVRGQFAAELHQTEYSMNDTSWPSKVTPTPTPLPNGKTELEDSYSRTVPIFGYGMSTGIERAYQLDRGNWLSSLVATGARSQTNELVKLKHTIEPNVQYTYIPPVNQDNNPLFDSLDRFRQRSLVSYGMTSRLYGRFQRPYERSRDVGELSSSMENLSTFDLSSSLLEFGRAMIVSPSLNVDKREAEIRELVTFDIRQTYDITEAQKDLQENIDPLSDLGIGLVLAPSTYFSFGGRTNYKVQDNTVTSNEVMVGFQDDREDALRFRYTFVNGTELNDHATTSQIAGNLEIKLDEQLRVGYYMFYDDKARDVVETKGLLRYINPCRCWSLDLGFRETLNPQRQQVLLTFTFTGLGDITQAVGVPQQQDATTP